MHNMQGEVSVLIVSTGEICRRSFKYAKPFLVSTISSFKYLDSCGICRIIPQDLHNHSYSLSSRYQPIKT